MSVAVCPCCLRPYEGKPDPNALLRHMQFGGVKKGVLEVLIAHFDEEVSTPDIVDWVYRYGGPLTAHQGIKVHAFLLRKVLEPYGLTILGSVLPPGAFRLTWIEMAKAAA